MSTDQDKADEISSLEEAIAHVQRTMHKHCLLPLGLAGAELEHERERRRRMLAEMRQLLAAWQGDLAQLQALVDRQPSEASTS